MGIKGLQSLLVVFASQNLGLLDEKEEEF